MFKSNLRRRSSKDSVFNVKRSGHGGAEIARHDIARPDNPAPRPLRWFRLPSVLRFDVEENDWTVRERVPTSTTAGAAIRTDVCDGGLWGGVSGGIFPR